MTNEVLKIENLKKVIGKRTIVSDISIELKEGEIFGFLGPNGAGKCATLGALLKIRICIIICLDSIILEYLQKYTKV